MKNTELKIWSLINKFSSSLQDYMEINHSYCFSNIFYFIKSLGVIKYLLLFMLYIEYSMDKESNLLIYLLPRYRSKDLKIYNPLMI